MISENNKISQKGENNSQFGTVWIKKDELVKKVKKQFLESYTNDGWIRGR